ncbi:MAG: DUF885 domain-containing protein [Planctomycetes bacterium]|nr:DUF885 domain-containing protein [Planctomycetota bacterium]
MRTACLLALALASCEAFRGPDLGPVGRMPEETPADDRLLDSLAEACVAWRYSQDPGAATLDGIHEYDDVAPSASRGDIDARLAALQYHLRTLRAIDRTRLSPASRIDAGVLDAHLRGEILELDRIRPWESDPTWYCGRIGAALHSLAAFRFEPADRRMEHAARRLRGVGTLLHQARENLKNPARLRTETAIAQFEGLHRYVRRAMPAAFAEVLVPALDASARDGAAGLVRERERLRAWQDFMAARADALKGVEEFVDWMRKELLDRSNGPVALGAEIFAELLECREMVRTPVPELLKRGYDLLAETRRRIDSEALRTMGATRADGVLDEMRALLPVLRSFAADVVTLAPDPEISILDAPAFRGPGDLASSEISGNEAHLCVTTGDLPIRARLPLLVAAELWPGRCTQALRLRDVANRVRRSNGSRGFADGWAFYCEQLYVESASDRPEIAIAGLHSALVRIARGVAAIEIHGNGMTLDGAAALLEKEAFLDRPRAEREARIAALDPLIVAQILGREEFLRLRAAERARLGPKFSLKAFHDRLLSCGQPPLPALEEILGAGR